MKDIAAHPGTEVRDPDDAWIARFYAGDRAVLEGFYRDHCETAKRAARSIVSGADLETVVHEVFFRLISSERARRSLQRGGFASQSAWLSVVARNHAIDYIRRFRRETSLADVEVIERDAAVTELEDRAAARLVVERFRREILPPKWEGVFEARLLRQLDQRTAARELGMSRTTLAYRELRIRALLKKFLLGNESVEGRTRSTR